MLSEAGRGAVEVDLLAVVSIQMDLVALLQDVLRELRTLCRLPIQTWVNVDLPPESRFRRAVEGRSGHVGDLFYWIYEAFQPL